MNSLLDFGSEEDIWVLRVELEGFSDEWPAKSAGRERQFHGGGRREELEDWMEKKKGENENGKQKPEDW